MVRTTQSHHYRKQTFSSIQPNLSSYAYYPSLMDPH